MPLPWPEVEQAFVWTGTVALAAGCAFAWSALERRRRERIVASALWLGGGAMSAAITVRWLALGQGPFLTLYEVLLSNAASLSLLYAAAYTCVRPARAGAGAGLPVLLLVAVWCLATPTAPQPLPATYDNAWLWVHVGAGKLFLGGCLVAAGLSAVLWLRSIVGRDLGGIREGEVARLDTTAWWFLMGAFCFETLMLVAGAGWARDAWGRFWAWDSLETWSLVTWLAAGTALHIRVTYRRPQLTRIAMVTVLALAFLTFLGVPFVSEAPHKGIL